MTINLQKGQREDLTKAGLTSFLVGLGWDTTRQGAEVDLDVSAFICNHNAAGEPKMLSAKHFIYFNNLKSPDGSVIHTGDNLTGDGDGDDEMLKIDLSKVDPDAVEINIIVTIYQAKSKGQNFGQVKNAYIRIAEMDASGNPTTEVLRFDLEEDYSAYTAVQFGSIYKKNGEWKFEAAGFGYNAEIDQIVDSFKA